MTDGTQSNTQEQGKKQRYDYIRWYQFVKWVSGNPGGRPKGSKSLKTFAREYLERLPDEEKIEFLKALPEEIVWKMAEGMPQSNTDITTNGEWLQPVLVKFIDGANGKDNWDTKGVQETVW